MRGVRCSGNLPARWTGHDLEQDFLLHKTPRPIARCALLVCEKFFDVVVIEASSSRVEMRASLAVARAANTTRSLADCPVKLA